MHSQVSWDEEAEEEEKVEAAIEGNERDEGKRR